MGYGGIDVDDLNEARAERDAARAQLAEVTRERDEARAKVAGLTLNPDAVARAKGACSYFAALDLMTDHGRAKHRETVEELTRYAEALGVRS